MLVPVVGVLFDGFAYGMLLFLLSVGLSVTLGMMNFVNLAHCSFAMLGRLRHGHADRRRSDGRSSAALPVAFARRRRGERPARAHPLPPPVPRAAISTSAS